MTEIREKAIDLYNTLVRCKSSGFCIKFEDGYSMEVVIAKDITPLFEQIKTNGVLEGVKE